MDHDRDDALRKPPQDWVDALERAKADVAAGRLHDWADVRAELLAVVEETEAELASRQT